MLYIPTLYSIKNRMKNFNTELDKLNFHDSSIEKVIFESENGLLINIHYYNWEGNQQNSDSWKTKMLSIKVDYCVHYRFSSPGLNFIDVEILDQEPLEEISKLTTYQNEYKENLKLENFENVVAYKFKTQSFGDSIFGTSIGFLEFAGFNVNLEWSEEISGSPIHIEVK